MLRSPADGLQQSQAKRGDVYIACGVEDSKTTFKCYMGLLESQSFVFGDMFSLHVSDNVVTFPDRPETIGLLLHILGDPTFLCVYHRSIGIASIGLQSEFWSLNHYLFFTWRISWISVSKYEFYRVRKACLV